MSRWETAAWRGSAALGQTPSAEGPGAPTAAAAQQLVDQFAAYLAQGFGCSQLVVMGRDGRVGVHPAAAKIVEVGGGWAYPAAVRAAGADRSLAGPTRRPTDEAAWPPLPSDLLARSIVVCSLEPGARDTNPRLAALRRFLDHAPAALLTSGATEERERTPGSQDQPLSEPRALEQLLVRHGLNVPFVGWVGGGTADGERRNLIAVLENNQRPPRRAAPADFRVLAIMPTYNEEEIVGHTLRYLLDQGLQVYLIDNWSTDATLERARPFLGRGLLGIERFPEAGPPGTYDLREILGRVEALSCTLEADWCVLYDADERRRSPWPGMSLKDGIYYADRGGFNCIDHVTVNYWPVDNRFDPSHDVEGQLTHFELSDHPGHFHQRRGWKQQGQRVALAPTAGHDVGFPGRRVYPFKFLLKHYPIRSQAHGERKLLGERLPRWNAEERSFGWHAQYDQVVASQRFLRDSAELEQADEATFHERYLVQRLSGLGIFRQPPPWATPPR